MSIVTVKYSPDLQDDSIFAKAESVANVCRAPTRWLAELWNGHVVHIISKSEKEGLTATDLKIETTGMLKVVKSIIGVILAIPGQIIALPFMAIASASPEIRLKNIFASRKLTATEKEELQKLIGDRQRIAKERQGCEPMSCLLFSICCLLCCLVCK